MKKVIRILVKILLALLGLVVIALGVLTAAEYHPADREAVLPTGEAAAQWGPGDSLTVVTWNTGYGALGDNADFFMDGGSGVLTADRSRVESNLNAMSASLTALDPDLILLQEVDVNSDRSHHVDGTAFFRAAFPGYASAFAANYRALYVPYPVPPIGHVDSGILTLSRAPVASAERIQLPCPFSWPVRIVNLKRCLLVSRIPLRGTERELVLVNLHLEAYDNGEGKAAQAAMLAAFLQEEAARGNYLIVGGDFNQIFTNVENPWPVYEGKWQPGLIDTAHFPDGFSLLMDPAVPTCRSLDRPLAGASTEDFQFYVIDGFIVSDNVRVDALETLDLGFTATDHNPVRLRLTLAE